MKNLAIALGIILVIGIGAFAYMSYTAPATETPLTTAPPTFAWRYEQSDEMNLDDQPKTNIYLDATYSTGVESKLIDTVDGGCNDLPDKDADSLSTTIQCYWAGFGYRFKVVAGIDSYLVQRQEFEEASPDYEPPIAEYETAAEFPLGVTGQ